MLCGRKTIGLLPAIVYMLISNTVLAEGQGLFEQVKKLESLHQQFYFGKSFPSTEPEKKGTDEEIKKPFSTDLLADYLQKCHKPTVAASDKEQLLAALDELDRWLEKREKPLKTLAAHSKEVRTSLKRLTRAVTKADKVKLRDYGLDLAKARQNSGGDLAYLLSELTKELAARNGTVSDKARALALELGAVLDRYSALDQWLELQFKWIGEDREMLRKYMDNIKRVWRRRKFFEFLPAGFDLNVRQQDIREIQKQIEFLLHLSKEDVSNFGKTDITSLIHAAPGNRQFVKKVFSKLDAGAKDTFKACWDNPLHAVYLNCLFRKYKDGKCDARMIATVVNRWNKSFKRPAGNSHVLDLLEVLNFKQGTVHSCGKPQGRFDKKIWDVPLTTEADAKADPLKMYKPAERIVCDKGYKWLAEMFRGRTDCYAQATAAGLMLANSGCPGVYPIIVFGQNSPEEGVIDHLSHHAEIVIRADNSILFPNAVAFGLAYGDDKKPSVFPPPRPFLREDPGSAYVTFRRTIATWTWSRMYFTRDTSTLTRKIPYYEQTGSQRNLRK